MVNTISEDLHDIILVGHAMGGMVTTGVADRVPIASGVWCTFDAFVPNDGECNDSVGIPILDWLKNMIKGDYIVPCLGETRSPAAQRCPAARKDIYRNHRAEEQGLCSHGAGTYILTVEAGKEPKDDDFCSQSQRAKERAGPSCN